MQARFSILIAFALGASLVLAAGRAGFLPPRVVPAVQSTPSAERTDPCPPQTTPPTAADEARHNEPHEAPAGLARVTVCEQSHGLPSLQALTLGAEGRPAFAVHCGDRVEVVTLSDDAAPSPQRVVELAMRTPGPGLTAMSAPVMTQDISGDGQPDLLVGVRFDDTTGAPRSGALYELVGDGHGAFAAPVLLGSQPVVALAMGQLYGVDTADIAVIGLQDPRQGLASDLMLLHGGAAPVRGGRLKVGVGVQSAVTLDLDLDARDDVLMVGGEPNAQVVYLDAQGAERSRGDWPLAGAARALAADVDGDGHNDAVMVGDTVSLLLASAAQTEPRVIDGGPSLRSVQTADVDDNGKLDLVAYGAPDVIALVQGDGLSFTRRVLCSLPTDTLSPVAIAIASPSTAAELVLLILAADAQQPSRIELAAAVCRTGAAPTWQPRTAPLRNAPLRLRYDLR